MTLTITNNIDGQQQNYQLDDAVITASSSVANLDDLFRLLEYLIVSITFVIMGLNDCLFDMFIKFQV